MALESPRLALHLLAPKNEATSRHVDDFKLAGPKHLLLKGWDMIAKGITLEKPTPLGLCLGCTHIQGHYKLPYGTPVRTVTYDMETFFVSCI